MPRRVGEILFSSNFVCVPPSVLRNSHELSQRLDFYPINLKSRAFKAILTSFKEAVVAKWRANNRPFDNKGAVG